eukprot:CAMPEP_0197439858 /NCGR_PEP_ID=MMETSP1175-20131217/6510_1 /TAXON_ID=1003142 /ORGANISM="Triceratium dubium, Strain CCMP147" /LENGTH=171 /DNA_ID=CAMNT_0042969853 /DNA_START=49 /DNA_END=564 /DNA_ORIENTATION=-
MKHIVVAILSFLYISVISSGASFGYPERSFAVVPRGGAGIFSRAVEKAEEEAPKLGRRARRAAEALDDKTDAAVASAKDQVKKGKKKAGEVADAAKDKAVQTLETGKKRALEKAVDVEEEARSRFVAWLDKVSGKAEEEAKKAAEEEAKRAAMPLWGKLTQVLGFPSTEED